MAVDLREVLHEHVVAASETCNTALERRLAESLGVQFVERPGTARDKRPVREIEGVDRALCERWSQRRSDIVTRQQELSREFQKAGLVATPTPGHVKKYLEKWRAQGNESSDSALRLLFKTMPKNVDLGQVAVKVAALNGLYSTSIYGVVQMAYHIVELDIDDALAAEVANAQLVEKIAHLTLQAKTRRHYSFATKYCSFHRPDVYPIYDSLVVEVLDALLNQGEKFDTFAPGEHWRTDYGVYCRSIEGFRNHFGLEDLSIRDIDKYLWMLAKERRGSGA